MKKMFVLVLACAILLGMLASCGIGAKETYAFIFKGSQDVSVTATFAKGTLTIEATAKGGNSNVIDNIAVSLMGHNMSPGTYEYTEENGIYTTTTSLSPMLKEVVVFTPYDGGKYLISSAFKASKISTTSTEGLGDFTMTTDVLGMEQQYVFHSDGTYDDGDEGQCTYTFDDHIIEMFYDGNVISRYFVAGDGNCYTEYLVRQ